MVENVRESWSQAEHGTSICSNLGGNKPNWGRKVRDYGKIMCVLNLCG